MLHRCRKSKKTMPRSMRITILLILVLFGGSRASDKHFYVSPWGSDQNDGTSPATPVKTIHKAMTLADNLKDKDTMVFIELMTGYHDLDKTLNINRDKVTLRAYQDDEVHVTGGRRVPSDLFKKVTDYKILSRLQEKAREYVRVAHLPDVGITDYGTMGTYGFAKNRVAPLEVFLNGNPLHFVRYPKEGFINIIEVIDGQNGTRFRYNSTQFAEPLSWHNEAEPWVYGYWYNSWADASVKIESLDPSTGIVNLTETPQFGLRTGHWNDPDANYTMQGGYFRFINILSALDEPGEYYMDRETGNLYVWFPNNKGNVNDTDIVYVSLIDRCIWINKRKNISLEGFTLEACRSYGINSKDGVHIQISKMEIRNTGSKAMLLQGDSRNCSVSQMLIHDTDGGVFIHGGDRPKLEPSGNTVEDNEIFQFARVAAEGSLAIGVYGVGHVVRYNHVYSGQASGVWYYGNDNLMEYNSLHHVCQNATDCGAFHTGRDWTTRGNIIRYNIVHHNLRLVPGGDVRGVMLDDQHSSTSIIHNVFYNNHVHTNIGGGRYNVIANNVMYNATAYSIQVDARGTTHRTDEYLIPRLYAMPYNSSLWISRYPELMYLNLKNASLPEGNQILTNLVFNIKGKEFVYGLSPHLDKPRFFNISGTEFSRGKSDFYNVDAGDFRLRGQVAEWAKSVNFGKIVTPDNVGPRVPVGPPHSHKEIPSQNILPSLPIPCTRDTPCNQFPVAAYLPDGSRDNDMFDVSNEGCWLSVSRCTDHPETVGTYRDVDGETNEHAADNETMCFKRAVATWRYCGSYREEQIAAIFGPSGATRLAGDGCFIASYGCPNHVKQDFGRRVSRGKIYRDKYAEQELNASLDEEACLRRAVSQWKWCGSYSDYPITSIYRPSGSIRTAGAGCWVHVQHCPKKPGSKSMFYDALGAIKYQTDLNEGACMKRAEFYWEFCGSDSRYPVTAYYRPSTASRTYVKSSENNDGTIWSRPIHAVNSIMSFFTASVTQLISSSKQLFVDLMNIR